MGTLNPYQAPFIDGNLIIHAANTISVNHFQLKLISEMFQMFALLINLLIFISNTMVFYLLKGHSLKSGPETQDRGPGTLRP